jgi:hypothetical protein
MQIRLKHLEDGTVFEYNGWLLRREGTIANYSSVQTSETERVLNPKLTENEYEEIVLVSPKIGGKFQTRLKYWLSTDMEVDVKLNNK